MGPNKCAPTTLDEALALIRALQSDIARLTAENKQLRDENRELRARLGQNSGNSSRPPSSDPPFVPRQRAKRPHGKRQRGAQPGHEDHRRNLLPAGAVDEIHDRWPERCRSCQQRLPVDDRQEIGEAERHQVSELPAIRPHVTEHRLHRLLCPHCGACTRAELPPGVSRQSFGPRAQAVVALLSGRFRLSRREVSAVCEEVLGLPISVGSVQELCERTSAAMSVPVAEAVAAVARQPVAHVDETGWRRGGERRWLWAVATGIATVFRIDRHRSSPVVRALLEPEFTGVLVTDRWSAYSWYRGDRQICWSHLARDLQGLADREGAGAWVGIRGVGLADAVFGAWHRFRDEHGDRTVLQRELAPIQGELLSVLERGADNPDRKTAGFCRKLLALWPWLWTFAEVAGVEPTNNRAERALRPAVLWRKGSFGCQSDAGERFVERILTVAATCRQHGRSLFTYLAAAIRASRWGLPPPSLLPTATRPG